MLHPAARGLLDFLEQARVPELHTLPPEQARVLYRERRSLSQPDPPEVGEVRHLSAPGPHGPVPLRAYRPLGAGANEALPVLMYYHGGGWVIGDLETHDTLCRQLANASGCAVVAVDYRLAPEHPYPCAVDDCWAATRWVSQQAGELGLDPDRMAVGGDSAGGNLAAVMALRARDQGDLPIAFQLLIYPATDARMQTGSHRELGEGYLLTAQTMAYFLDHYAPESERRTEPDLSPLLAARLADLPPALVLTAGFDPLRDEGLAYAQALTQAGNQATSLRFDRQIHGFITMGRLIDEANVAVALCAAELRRVLRGG